ncbi:hypothetical protein K7J14_00370 [Treponema zuelzerae]|uniref:Polysaccharide biosynthesis protein n=1 Tax=Teretinema zuelzerae TaxID=156 RepID=A0AAE3EEP3_9SPIR|nr:hypothetical protein [Teretinema zuelzerae]MCD1653165.1 hypothetical protein [Teretinema zuelzerae]
MLVSLYTVRVVLEVLGAEDYGIYNVVAGVVTMFSFLSGAMATASQRYFSFNIGRQNYEQLEKTFSVTLTIYILLIFVIVVVAESFGLWFIYNKLVIPDNRILAAKWVYHFSILSFAITLITTPYMSSIIAHENMNVYAYVSIIEVSLKLFIVFILKKLPFDKLSMYGVLLFVVGFINTSIYRGYCKKHYVECKFKLGWDKELFKEISNFTGWSIFGAFSTVARNQAITILINQFFNPIIVASRAISSQVSYALTVFSANFNTSLYAPIVKEYALDNKTKMYSLIFNGCKITFILMWFFALPLCLRMEYVLTIWLNRLPEYVVFFTILSVIEVLINSISLPITTAARAPGKMKEYELVLGSLQLLIFIVSFIWIKYFDGTAEIVFYSAILINLIMFIVRLYIVNLLITLPIRKFMIEVLIPVLVVVLFSGLPAYFINRIFPQNFSSLLLITIITSLSSLILFFLVGLTRDQKLVLIHKIKAKIT